MSHHLKVSTDRPNFETSGRNSFARYSLGDSPHCRQPDETVVSFIKYSSDRRQSLNNDERTNGVSINSCISNHYSFAQPLANNGSERSLNTFYESQLIPRNLTLNEDFETSPNPKVNHATSRSGFPSSSNLSQPATIINSPPPAEGDHFSHIHEETRTPSHRYMTPPHIYNITRHECSFASVPIYPAATAVAFSQPQPNNTDFVFTSTRQAVSADDIASDNHVFEHDDKSTTPSDEPPINAMPKHGENVHTEKVHGITMYQTYDTCDSVKATSKKEHYTHNPYAHRCTLRATCLPFEREGCAADDMQTVLTTLCRAYQNAAWPLSVTVEHATSKGHSMEFGLTTTDPNQLKAILNDAVVLMDRKGFHYTTNSQPKSSRTNRYCRPPANKQRLLSYCASIRRLPAKQRHWFLDGLPCSLVRFQLTYLGNKYFNFFV